MAKSNAANVLAKLIESVENPKVHELPKEKENKRDMIQLSKGRRTYYAPTLYLGTEDFPGMKDWKAGEKVHLAITCEVGNISTNQMKGEDARVTADLKVTAISDITKWQESKKK